METVRKRGREEESMEGRKGKKKDGERNGREKEGREGRRRRER